MDFKIKCLQCGESIRCDETILDQQLACGDCGCPIALEHYPRLVKLKQERDAALKAERDRQKQIKNEERQQARQLKAAAKAESQAFAMAQKRARQRVIGEAQALQQAQAQAQVADEQKERLQHGAGCPKCGSLDWHHKTKTTGAGWGLFFGGISLAFFTCGAGLVLCIIAVFLNERITVCRNCRWQWK